MNGVFSASARRRLGRAVRLAGCAAAAIAAPAWAQERLAGDVSLSGGISVNPFQQADSASTPTVGSATLEVRPEWTLLAPLTTVRISGAARVTEYFSTYPTNDSYSLNIAGERRTGENSQLNAELGYSNTVIGSFLRADVPVEAPELPTFLPGFVDNVALGVAGERQSTYQGMVGYTDQIGPYDTLAGRVTFSAVRYSDDTLLEEYDSVTPGISYSRLLDEGFSVGANVDVNLVEYRGQRLGDGYVVTPTLQVFRTLDSRWSLAASAGVSIARYDELVGSRSSTGFAGSLSACRRADRSNICLTASRQQTPSSLQGIRNATSVSFDAGLRLSPRSDLSVIARYSRSSAPLIDSVDLGWRDGAVEFLEAGVTYNHRLAERLYGFASGGVIKTYTDDLSRPANAELRAGVRYRFGRLG